MSIDLAALKVAEVDEIPVRTRNVEKKPNELVPYLVPLVEGTRKASKFAELAYATEEDKKAVAALVNKLRRAGDHFPEHSVRVSVAEGYEIGSGKTKRTVTDVTFWVGKKISRPGAGRKAAIPEQGK